MKIVIFLGLITICFSQGFDEKDPRAIIEKVRIYRLTQDLDLTTEQAVKFFPKLNELQKIEREFHEQRMRILSELKHLLKKDDVEKDIIKIVSKYEDAHKEKVKNEIKKLKEMWEVLTPVQTAKYLIFQEEFNHEIMEMIKEIKRHRFEKP